jgi:K+-sensing histidine kinase KdpD
LLYEHSASYVDKIIKGTETGRFAGGAAHEIPGRVERENGASARPDDLTDIARPSRRGDRIRRFNRVVIELIGPIVTCFALVLVTTLLLSTIDSFVPTEHLMLGYLLPAILVAIYFGSSLAVLTSFASGLSAAYFLLPPKFSFYVDDPVHVAELGFTIVLAVIASKVVGVLANDLRRPIRTSADEVIE